MLKDIISIPNFCIDGTPFYMKLNIYNCDYCGIEFDDSAPHHHQQDEHYCFKCAFLNGYISEKEFLDYGIGFSSRMFRAFIENNQVKIKPGKYTPEELRQRRNKRARERYKKKKQAGVVI